MDIFTETTGISVLRSDGHLHRNETGIYKNQKNIRAKIRRISVHISDGYMYRDQTDICTDIRRTSVLKSDGYLHGSRYRYGNETDTKISFRKWSYLLPRRHMTCSTGSEMCSFLISCFSVNDCGFTFVCVEPEQCYTFVYPVAIRFT